jgi:hypothetical protein
VKVLKDKLLLLKAVRTDCRSDGYKPELGVHSECDVKHLADDAFKHCSLISLKLRHTVRGVL